MIRLNDKDTESLCWAGITSHEAVMIESSGTVRRSSSEASRLQIVTKGFEGKDECCINFGHMGSNLYAVSLLCGSCV